MSVSLDSGPSSLPGPPASAGTGAMGHSGPRTTKTGRLGSLRSRRVTALMATQIAIVVAYAIYQAIENRLGRTSTYTGAMLAVCFVMLTLLGARKRLPIARAGSVATWTQVHLYTSAFCMAVYAMHVPRIIADGWIEGPLSIAFLLVAASGIYGIIISRTYPKRLTTLGREYRFDRFGFHRQQIREKAEQTVGISREQEATSSTSSTAHLQASSTVTQAGLASVESSVTGAGTTTEAPDATAVLGAFYRDRLSPYFSRRPAWRWLAWNRSVPRQRLMQELRELDRYLDDDQRETAGTLSALVRMRDELDQAWTLQLRLRLWLSVHGIVTVGLIALATVHVWAVLGFTR